MNSQNRKNYGTLMKKSSAVKNDLVNIINCLEKMRSAEECKINRNTEIMGRK